MKKTSAALLMALALALPAITVSAQQDNNPQPNPPARQPRGERIQPPPSGDKSDGPREGGQRPQGNPRLNGQLQDPQNLPQGQRPPTPPLMAALDTNGDGVIDEKEIAAASKSLKKLDKNGDGKLTMDELRPSRPMNQQQGGPGAPGGNGGPNGANGPRPLRGEGNGQSGGQGGGQGGFHPDGPPPADGERPARRGPPQPQGDK